MEQVIERKIITICIKHSDLEIKELSELLYIINLSINDYYRENGIAGSQLSHYAPTIQSVQQGSIILDLLLAILEDIAGNAAVDLIAKCFKKRIDLLSEKYVRGRTKKKIFNYEITTRIEISIESGKLVIEVKKPQ